MHLACDALGLATDDPRGLTVTGGLPFAGGAGSNYMLHSIATMVDVLRGDPGSLGLVTGVGMHMTKHCFGVYSTTPPDGAVAIPDSAGVQRGLEHDHPPVPITDIYAGSANVVSYTVAHGRDGAADWGLVIGDIGDGSRAYGKVEDAGLMADLEARELVGETVELVTGDNGVNLVKV